MFARIAAASSVLLTLAACDPAPTTPTTPEEPHHATEGHDALIEAANRVFAPVPEVMDSATNPVTDAKVTLGRALYYETRLSKNHDRSCNSCHMLDNWGVDGTPTSSGHKGQFGGRNSPTVYHAALHATQFWDGRAADVEAQAKGPVLNPIEMAMPDEASVVAVLKSIPGYLPLFEAAFPGEADPITYDNMARAIGAFERKLVTPSPFDAFLKGDAAALTDRQRKGLEAFMSTGCASCHSGQALGGQMFQKLGLVHPYETADRGRAEVTGDEADALMFKVPSLRNIAKTGPYFHDGSVATLEDAVKLMAHHQLGKELDQGTTSDILAFLGSLTGALPMDYIAKPQLPESGPTTPKPDPS